MADFAAPLMSALGQKRTLSGVKADIAETNCHARFVPKAVRLSLPVPSDPESSACALPRVRFGFVGHTFERSIVGFLVSLGLLRLGLICLLLMFVTAAAHALRAGADRR